MYVYALNQLPRACIKSASDSVLRLLCMPAYWWLTVVVHTTVQSGAISQTHYTLAE